MPDKSAKLRQLNTLALTVLVLLGPFTLYYFFYFSGQKSYFTNRDFRLLAVLSKQIEMKVDGTARAFQKAAASAAKAYPVKHQEGFKIDGFLQPIIRDGTNIEAMPIAPVNTASHPKAIAEEALLTLNVRPEDGGSSLYFDYAGYHEKAGKFYPLPLQAKSRLEELIGPFLRKLANQKDFDSVLVVAEDGKVIFEECPAELGLTNVDSLVDRDHKKIDFGLLKQNSNVVDVELAQTSYKLFIQPVQLTYSQTGSESGQGARWIVCGLVHSGHFFSESAGISYTILIVFTFLCVIVALSAPFLKLLFMGARERLRMADVYFLTFSALMGSALATGFLVYTISYADLENKMEDHLESLSKRIIGNFESELRDANKQLDTLNADPDLHDTVRILRRLDELDRTTKLEHNATKIAKADRERHDLKQKLDVLDEVKGNESTSNRNDPEAQSNYECALPKRCSGRTRILAGLVRDKDLGTDKDGNTYPYFSTAMWIDNDGQQRIKWTTESDLPSFNSVKSRSYFQGIVNGRTWDYEGNDRSKLFDYLLEPVYSMSTGGQQVILSAALKDEAGKPADKWVSALAIRPLSLLQTVLPADLGYGYCVIDIEGNVVFHSDSSRNLLENFFAETDNDGYLRSAVLANESKGLNLRYQGVDHRLFVKPIPNTPWTLVTFRDRQILRTAALELITCSLCLFVLYAFVLTLICRLFYLGKAQNRAALIWPDAKRASNYYLSIAVNLVLAAALLILIFVAKPWTVFALTILLPLSGFLFQHYNLQKGLKVPFGRSETDQGERHTRSYRFGYVCSLVTLLLLVSVLPMLAFFKFSYDREMTLFVRLGQINLARGLEDRAMRVQEQYSRSAPSRWPDEWQKAPTKFTAFIEARLKRGDHVDDDRFSDVYSQFFFNTPLDLNLMMRNENFRKPRSADATFASFLDRILPLNNTISLRIRGRTNGVSGDTQTGTLPEVPDSKGKLNWYTSGKLDGDDDYEVLAISSDVPVLGKRQGTLWWIGLLATLTVVPILLYLLVRFIGRRIFLLDTEPAKAYGEELCEEDVSQNALVLASSFTRKDQLLEREDFDVIDLRNMKKKGWDWSSNGQRQRERDHKTVAINYFEYNREDPKTNLEKIRLLESLLIHNRKVVVVSTVDLTDYRFEENGNGHANGNGNHVNGSRVKLLDSLYKTHVEDKGHSQSFLNKLQEQEQAWRDRPRWETNGRKRLLKLLEKECEPRAHLQKIGESLLTKRGLANLTPEKIISHVQEQANSYYHAIWETCSQDEKLTLCNLSKYRLVSSKNPDLPRLLGRGLICKRPNLQPMNESFSRFIMAEGSPEKLAAWQRESEDSSWALLRIPFFIILISAAAFLFVSQRELYNSTLAFVSAFAAGMPSLLKILGMFQSGRAGSAVQ